MVFSNKEVLNYVPLAKISYSEMITELQGILNYRRKTYPETVKVGKMDNHLANYKIRCIEAAIERLKQHSKQSELF